MKIVVTRLGPDSPSAQSVATPAALDDPGFSFDDIEQRVDSETDTQFGPDDPPEPAAPPVPIARPSDSPWQSVVRIDSWFETRRISSCGVVIGRNLVLASAATVAPPRTSAVASSIIVTPGREFGRPTPLQWDAGRAYRAPEWDRIRVIAAMKESDIKLIAIYNVAILAINPRSGPQGELHIGQHVPPLPLNRSRHDDGWYDRFQIGNGGSLVRVALSLSGAGATPTSGSTLMRQDITFAYHEEVPLADFTETDRTEVRLAAGPASEPRTAGPWLARTGPQQPWAVAGFTAAIEPFPYAPAANIKLALSPAIGKYFVEFVQTARYMLQQALANESSGADSGAGTGTGGDAGSGSEEGSDSHWDADRDWDPDSDLAWVSADSDSGYDTEMSTDSPWDDSISGYDSEMSSDADDTDTRGPTQ